MMLDQALADRAILRAAPDLTAILALAAAGGPAVVDIGRVEYDPAIQLQRQLREAA